MFVWLAMFSVMLLLQNFLKFCIGDNSSVGGNESSFPRKVMSRARDLVFSQPYDDLFFYFFSIGAQSTCSSLLSSWSWSSSSIEYLSCSSFFLHHWPREDHHWNKNQNSWNNETNGKVEEPAHKKTIFTSSFK